jgi:hypothetical protein
MWKQGTTATTIETFGFVPGCGFVDYAQSLIKQNKHKNRVPIIVLYLFMAKIFPPIVKIHKRNYVLTLWPRNCTFK